MKIEKFKLVEAKIIDVYHFQMVEGKFIDLENKEMNNINIYVYGNISNFDTETIRESEVRVYAHSFEDLYDAEQYELYHFEDDYSEEIRQQLLETEEYKKFVIRYETGTHGTMFINEFPLKKGE